LGSPAIATDPPAAWTVWRSGTVVKGVVGALGVHVGPEPPDEAVGRLLVEQDHVVHALERCQDLGALGHRHERAARPLEAPDRGIPVEPDEEHVAELPGRGEVADVTHVEEVEATRWRARSACPRREGARRARPLVRAEQGGARTAPGAGARAGPGRRDSRAVRHQASDQASWARPPRPPVRERFQQLRRSTVAVPRFITTMPPAMLASCAASNRPALPASATVNALITVSPAPVTSAISVAAEDRDQRGPALALHERQAPAAARHQEVARLESVEELAARLLQRELVVDRHCP